MQESVRDKVYSKIRRDIMIGKLSPGERLVESKLSQKLRVSRGLIREALLQLTIDGFLTSQKYKGISVTKLTLKQIDEIYSLRSILEAYAVRLSVAKMGLKGLTQLSNTHKALQKATIDRKQTDWTDINIDFHNFFIQNSDNSYLIQMLDGLRYRTFRYSTIIINIPGVQETFLKDHENILKSCEAGEPVAAQLLMIKHIVNTKVALLEQLKHFPGIVA